MNTKNLKKKEQTREISNTTWSTPENKYGVTSKTDKFDDRTVLNIFPDKHPESRKADLSYLVGNEHPEFCHAIVTLQKLNAPQWLEDLPWRLRQGRLLTALMPTNGKGFWHPSSIFSRSMQNHS